MDADVERFLKLYTELPVDECARLGSLAGSEINHAKIILANEATRMLHGDKAAEQAEETSRQVFEQGGKSEDLPTLSLSKEEIGSGISVVQLLVGAGLAKSGKEAKRLIAENGARIDDEVISDPNLRITAEAIEPGVKISAGKKRHALVAIKM